MIKFDTDVGSFSTFDEVGAKFIKLMGHSGSVPGAIDAGGVEEALANVRSALAGLPPEEQADAPVRDGNDDDDEGNHVPLARRATALVTLLEDAARHDSGVRWRAA